jgi:acetyl-CoA synthetase
MPHFSPPLSRPGETQGDAETVTYAQLLERVCQLANYLHEKGVRPGDTVLVYLPMRLELPVAMLACARLGAIHSVVFGGFSAEAVSQRIVDCSPKVCITTTSVRRGAKPIGLKAVMDAALALAATSGVQPPTVLVAENEGAQPSAQAPFTPGRDEWWSDVVSGQPTSSPVAWMDAEDPLFMLYTSGSTGKPKGVVHTTGGYMVYTATTFKHAFDYRPGDVYWCTADCGWITGHSYLAYGPLLCGATQVVFEGVPTFPDAGRLWRIVDKHAVSLFYTAPTAIRSLERLGDQWLEGTSRASLRVLGSVGEPINAAAWEWYHAKVGLGKCPISDTWWQTETGGHMIMPLPGAVTQKPGAAALPFFGVQPCLLDPATGAELGGAAEGVLCVKAAWPGAARTLFGDAERFETTYYKPYKGYYFTSDGARRDEDGYYWITGAPGSLQTTGSLVLTPSQVAWTT